MMFVAVIVLFTTITGDSLFVPAWVGDLECSLPTGVNTGHISLVIAFPHTQLFSCCARISFQKDYAVITAFEYFIDVAVRVRTSQVHSVHFNMSFQSDIQIKRSATNVLETCLVTSDCINLALAEAH
jgi:hypothetical protein